MTKSSFPFFQLMKYLGAASAQTRLVEATRELHLLKTAEHILGHSNVDYVENIGELKSEYWQVMALRDKIAAVEKEQEEVMVDLQSAFDNNHKVDVADEEEVKLREEVALLQEKLESYKLDEEGILQKGRIVQKTIKGLQAQLEYYKAHQMDASEGREKIAIEYTNLKNELISLKGQRNILVEKMTKLKFHLDKREDLLEQKKKKGSLKFKESNLELGYQNKRITKLLSQKSVLETELDSHTRFIGRYLLSNSDKPEVKKCIQARPQIVRQAKALKVSIALNHRLAGRDVQFANIEDKGKKVNS